MANFATSQEKDVAALRKEALSILGLDRPGFDEREEVGKKLLRRAFLDLSREYHPDKNNGDRGKYSKIREAYDLLTQGGVEEEFFCVSSGKDKHGSSVSLNKQNPSHFASKSDTGETKNSSAVVAESVVFLLCPLCNQPYKKGRPMRAHLQSDRHSLSDLTDPKLGDVVLQSMKGVHVEAKVLQSVAEPYSTVEDASTFAYVSVNVTGMKLLTETANVPTERNCFSTRGCSKRRKLITAHQGRLRAKKKAAAAAATIAIKSKKLLHPGLTACRDGDMESLKSLLENGQFEPLERHDSNGSSGIHWCSGSGHLAILKYLLDWCKIKRGVDSGELVKYRDTRSGRNSFHWAARNGQIAVCEWLVESFDVDLDSTTNDGTSAFHLAAWSGELEMCKWLVDNGGNPHIVNSFGCNAIHFACLAGNLAMCKWLHDEIHLDAFLVQLQGHHTLHKAAWAGHKDVCEWLQDLGVDPECKEVDKKGHTASRLAEIAGHVELSQWLVRRRKKVLPLKK